MRLTLWYCGVLVAALVIFGVSLYLGTKIALLTPIQSEAQNHARDQAYQWSGAPGSVCPSPGRPGPGTLMGQGHDFIMPNVVICFDAHGNLSPGQTTTALSSALLNNGLVREALQSSTGQATVTVDAEDTNGLMYCYAQVALDPTKNIMGVVVVGEPIQAQYNALSTLLSLLLSVGIGALLCAGLGGLFLANRALEPARLAWANQQRFIADASHELRTPLTLMRADAEVLLRGREQLETEDAALLEDIVVEASHMAKITTNLLTLARLDTQFAHREHEVVDLAQLVGATVRRIQALANQREMSVQERHASDAYVIGDSTLLEQAVLVLLDNAIKYNRPGGTISIDTTVQHDQVSLEIQDSGIGITPEHLPYLGERFYRVDKARSRAAGGTGLGLSIARSIANTHGGQLTLASVPGQGTTAILTLPLAHQAREALPASIHGNAKLSNADTQE